MRFSILLLLLLPLICHVATTDNEIDAETTAFRLMILLKDSIDLQQIDALKGFVSHEFTWNNCTQVLNRDKFVKMLKIKSEHTGPWPPMSTDWSVTDAHFNDATLYFKIHNNNQKYAKYPDWQFAAEKHDYEAKFIYTKGKDSRCGPLESKSK